MPSRQLRPSVITAMPNRKRSYSAEIEVIDLGKTTSHTVGLGAAGKVLGKKNSRGISC